MISSPETHHSPSGEVVLVRLSGDLDLAESPKIQGRLQAVVPKDALGLVLDLGAVRYLDSAGVRLLFQMRRRLEQNRQQFRLVVPETAFVRRVLAFANLESHIPIYPTTEGALAGFNGKVHQQRSGYPEAPAHP
jgi:anti-sigma B factor antagonist